MTAHYFRAQASLLKTIGFSVLLILGLIVGLEGPLFAQNQSILAKPTTDTSSSTSSVFSDTQGQITLREESFISPDYNQTINKNFYFIGGGLDTLSRARKESEISDGLQTQTVGAVAPGESVLSYLNVAQLYWKQEHLIVGRRKEIWSNLDEIWTLGLYQPLFKWNPIMPEEQGLSGIFLQFSKEDSQLPWGVMLFGSPLFIPNQEASFEVEKGKFIASNPYFGKRPTQARVGGQSDEIQYQIQKPNLEKIVFNQSFAAKAYLGNPRSGFLAQIGFANKPVNDLALGIDAFATPNSTVEVTVQPEVAYHTLTSADVQYTFQNFALGLSGVKENRKNVEFEKQWTYTDYESSTLVSPYAKFRYRKIEILASYLDISGGEKNPQGNLATEAKDFLAPRYPFGDSYLLKVSLAQRLIKGQGLKITAAYQQGAKNEYGLVTGTMGYQFDPSWSFSLAGQLIRVADNEAGDATKYSSFVNNDSASVGVQYVF